MISAEMNPDKAVQTIIKETARLIHAERYSPPFAFSASIDLILFGSFADAWSFMHVYLSSGIEHIPLA